MKGIVVNYKKNKKIFIVEDNDLNLKLFKDLLEANGYDVSFTNDGLKAFVLIKEALPDLILMDIQLKGVSGFDIIAEIKKDKTLKHIPVVAVTAFAMKDDKDKILASGCEEYISKPIAIEAFLETINHFVFKDKK